MKPVTLEVLAPMLSSVEMGCRGCSSIFGALMASRDQIDGAFGNGLEWQRLEGRRACRIAYRMTAGGWRDEEKWPEVHEAMIDAMIRLEAALRPHIEALEI